MSHPTQASQASPKHPAGVQHRRSLPTTQGLRCWTSRSLPHSGYHVHPNFGDPQVPRHRSDGGPRTEASLWAQHSPSRPRHVFSALYTQLPKPSKSDEGSPRSVSSQLPHPHHFPLSTHACTGRGPTSPGLSAPTDTVSSWAHAPGGREVTGSQTLWGPP